MQTGKFIVSAVCHKSFKVGGLHTPHAVDEYTHQTAVTEGSAS